MFPVITVENLGKRYRIGRAVKRPKNLREALQQTLGAPFQYLTTHLRHLISDSRNLITDNKQPITDSPDILWALKDVSFEVQQGEVLGIIGRNGAGKSTLLKILSRITDPTEGRALIRGRVNALLEVGTGFHQELTGRENIYMSAALHGMRRAETEKKLDEIVEFAEIGRFLDTPVKRYSSGMYTRLAFAVAAHLEPDIMIVDEVLAVGDASFQKKCLGKMGDVAREGRTVLFVSHNMPAIARLCPRVILMEAGCLQMDGASHEVLKHYLHSDYGTSAVRVWNDPNTAPGSEVARLRSVRVCTRDGRSADTMDIRQDIGIEITFEALRSGSVLVPNFFCHNEEGICVFTARESGTDWQGKPRGAGCYASTAWIPGNFMTEGSFVISVALSTMDPVRVHFFERDAVAFRVVDRPSGGAARGDFAGDIPGVVRPLLSWDCRFEAQA